MRVVQEISFLAGGLQREALFRKAFSARLTSA